MEIALFILLPEHAEIIDSIESQGSLDNLIGSLLQVKEFARKHKINVRVYYDSKNISEFEKAIELISSDEYYLKNPKNIIKTFIGTCSRDVSKFSLSDDQYSYTRWDTKSCQSFPELSILIKNSFEVSYPTCILSLSPKVPTDYHIVSIIKDKEYCSDLPVLKNVNLFFSVEDCIQCVDSQQENTFSLINNQNFVRTQYVWVKQAIFQNKEDSSYWYFDYYHKDNKIHYEVFDKYGEHMGEADVNGNLIPGTKDNNKRIDKIVH